MDSIKLQELTKLAKQYFQIAFAHVDRNSDLNEQLRKSFSGNSITEAAELPGFENKPMKFGKFENREFVIMMTDIRKSTDIINGPNGLVNMFLIFYIYAGIVAKIVDSYNGTSTEFLGDGVLNLFDTKDSNREIALRNSMLASWEILEARENVLNPFLLSVGLPQINFGIGIDHGVTIVTQFGYRSDTDLKAFGKCVYNASKLCKGFNQIIVSQNSQSVWPTGPGGNLNFGQAIFIDNKIAYPTFKSM
jgi:adenylate cyclase